MRSLAVIVALAALATPALAQTVREVSIPQALFPTGLAVAADGSVLVADRHGDRLIRFDAGTGSFSSVALEANTLPRDVVVDGRGRTWLAASGRGRVDRLEPGRARPQEFALPSLASAKGIPSPWRLALSAGRDVLWFTVTTGVVGRVAVAAEPDRRAFVVEEVTVATPVDRADGIAVAPDGIVWVALAGADQLVRIASDRTVRRIVLPAGSSPRGVAVGGDGAVWVTLFAGHRLLRLDPASLATRTWPLPAGERAAPLPVVIDAAGAVVIADYEANAIVRFEPGRERFTSWPLPTPRSRVEALAVDARGRIWYVGASSRRLGVLE
jgi:virginiamycin B lyase